MLWCFSPILRTLRGVQDRELALKSRWRKRGSYFVSDSHVGVRVAGGEGVVVGEDHGFSAVVAEGGFVVAADDGEGVEDVGGVVFGEAVEVEVEGVEAGAQVAAFFFVPDEGRAVVAEVAGEEGHVVGGVGEAEDVVADEGAGGGGAEGAVVVGEGDDGELLD